MTISELPQRKIQRYGWIPDLPDHRDKLFTEVRPSSKVPVAHDLWEKGSMPAIYDQLQLGSCTGNGWARVMQKILMEQGMDFGVPSRMLIYQLELLQNGEFGQDNGAQIRDGARVVSNMGVVKESEWAYYMSNFTVMPSDSLIQEAHKVEALQYERIVVGTPGAPMRSAISAGYPIVFGFPVPDYFEDESRWDPATQALPLPGADVQWIGGHCVVVTGFDFSQRKYRVPVFLCDNSWGESWGKAGRFAMDYRWFTPYGDTVPNALASDLWIVRKVS